MLIDILFLILLKTPIRNQKMLDDNPDIDIVIAFHSDLENSRGTKDMVNRARKKGIKVCIFTQ